MSRAIPSPADYPAYANFLKGDQHWRAVKRNAFLCGVAAAGSYWFTARSDDRILAFIVTQLLAALPGAFALIDFKTYSQFKSEASEQESLKFQALERQQCCGMRSSALLQFNVGFYALAALAGSVEFAKVSDGSTSSVLLPAAFSLISVALFAAGYKLFSHPLPPQPHELSDELPPVDAEGGALLANAGEEGVELVAMPAVENGKVSPHAAPRAG